MKLVRHELKATCHKTEIRGLEHCPSGSKKLVESELHKVGTRPCQCAENSPCEMDRFFEAFMRSPKHDGDNMESTVHNISESQMD